MSLGDTPVYYFNEKSQIWIANLSVKKKTALINALQCLQKHVLFLSHTHLISILDCCGAKSNKALMVSIWSEHALAYISYADPLRFSVVKPSQYL